ncbi:hypothetical protein F4560_005686 [Saccharothrix ecbatanensis]|uniref:PE family protein n=1 Tax=Saccharothrix ecbatanensis TaxID=1105145 RepID=A0A7W9M3H1_9PSEU|nr:hypothetical protein [Saccharothrix ecbatanensis]MBB5805918.1 hypothetical protein [Saccharothrix ecbatanensis]
MGESADTAEAAASLLATATAGTNNPDIAAAVAIFTEAYQQANDLYLQAIALRADLHALANRLASRAAPEPPPPPPPHPPDRIDQIRRSLP